MSAGLLALLDDVAALVKVSAATLDDIPAQVAKTTGKVSGIVIDDAAVTPKYVVGLDPARELSIIYNIAQRSLINKLAFLGPIALILGFFAPGLIQPLLMIGGAYLCFEGYEKIHSIFHKPKTDPMTKPVHAETITADELEKIRIKSAVRTDFILSAEIMAITFSTVADKDVMTQILVLLSVALVITIAVYGFVALVVKADDIGLYLAQQKQRPSVMALGRGIVKFMPHFLTILGYIGTAAMLWVGAEIIVHGVPFIYQHLHQLEIILAHLPIIAWLAKASICAILGVLIGSIIALTVSFMKRISYK